ncbi:uncharacterized protein N7479_000491 [Penicillium vulpinum]|uniref:Uncharacterized protein n=1 Tax=Penicillium vulpinum TaxID=29845 RepID=A0A1V6S5X2_9EURO|nr:uncharacterized protein N7479_000491 [Penicillium vulpinum]KAJ5970573.1 hypothetical protein N7479_000491 [Penicillium vulpinum]OQE09268.1 hypothetical protein PENVUL_c007G00976 [Penicillium vulpinum]
MDHRGLYCPGELDVLYQDQNRSETTICLPSPSPAKRGSSYYPTAGAKVLEESNLDPFYLEESLTATPSWNPYTSEMRNDSFEDATQYYPFSLTQSKDIHNPLQYPGPDRSTLAQVELENSLRFHRYTPSTEEHSPVHSSQISFSSVQTDSSTPDLTPSSSFSSSYDSPSCPNAVFEATEQLYKHARQVQIEPSRRFYLPASTPPTYSLPPPPPVPAFAPAEIRSPTSCFQHSNDSTTTITMGNDDVTGSTSSRTRRRKQPPVALNLSRAATSHSASRRKQSSPGTRPPPLDPSMISPPSLINPVTMEPHRNHFDQSFFIPANDCPSPVPSPVTSSPPISRQWTRTSMDRPSISTIDAFCEQSVWESDSDSESTGRKSMSRRPIDTLRKVRSRAKLRGTKSQPRLHQTMLEAQTSEQFPCMPEDMGEPSIEAFRPSMDRPRTSREAGRSYSGLNTLRLVAPSSTSLARTPRSRKNSSLNSSDVDRSAAAAFQAQFRRRQRSDSPAYSNPNSEKGEKEQLTSFCYDQHPQTPLNGVREQRPLFQRFMNSLRSLNCQKSQKSYKKSNVNTI